MALSSNLPPMPQADHIYQHMIDMLRAEDKGEQIEYSYKGSNVWFPKPPNPDAWDFMTFEYRVSTQTLYRPLLPSEVPVGSAFRHKAAAQTSWALATNVTPYHVRIQGNSILTFERLMTEGWMFTVDNGKTWKECKIKL